MGKISLGKEERHTLPSGREIIAQAAGLLKMEFSFCGSWEVLSSLGSWLSLQDNLPCAVAWRSVP